MKPKGGSKLLCSGHSESHGACRQTEKVVGGEMRAQGCTDTKQESRFSGCLKIMKIRHNLRTELWNFYSEVLSWQIHVLKHNTPHSAKYLLQKIGQFVAQTFTVLENLPCFKDFQNK